MNEKGNTRGKWLVPVISASGILLAAGLAFCIVKYNEQKGITEETERTLADVRASLTHERDSLSVVLTGLQQDLDAMTSVNEVLQADKEQLQDRNRQMASANVVIARERDRLREERTALSDALEAREAENAALEDRLLALQERIDEINRHLALLGDDNSRLAGDLEKKNERIASDSTAAAALADSLALAKLPVYLHITEINGGIGLGDVSVPYSKYFAGPAYVFGWQATDRLLAGIGAGVYFYNGGAQSPLFIDLRYRFRPGPNGMYLYGDGGVLFQYSDLASSGLFINPGIGYGRSLSEQIALNLGTGLFIQGGGQDYRSSFVNLKMGLSFGGKR